MAPTTITVAPTTTSMTPSTTSSSMTEYCDGENDEEKEMLARILILIRMSYDVGSSFRSSFSSPLYNHIMTIMTAVATTIPIADRKLTVITILLVLV